MQARAPQWLLMFCGGWTLFTLVNVTWQPLTAFQLALIWAGYAFLAPRGLPQRKLWEAKLWEAIQREGVKLAGAMYSKTVSTSLQMAIDAQPKAALVEPIAPAAAQDQKSRLNKALIFQIFMWIFAANVLIHLIPFNYSFDISVDQIARSFGSTLAIFVISLIGLLFRPNQTLGVALIAILIAPVCILIDRAHDPVAPRYFRELLYPDDKANGDLGPNSKVERSDTASADTLPASPNDVGTVPEQGLMSTATASTAANTITGDRSADAEYQRHLDQYLAANPATNPHIFDTSDIPAVEATKAQD